MAPFKKKPGFRNRIYGNLKMWIDDQLVRRGFFDTVASGETDWSGNDMSALEAVGTDPKYPVDSTNVHVWQSKNKNWVTESGVTLKTSGVSDPVIASGVFINGQFHPRRAFDGTSGLAVDYRNGRVIVESGLPSTYTVQATYSYKDVWVDTVSRDLITTEEGASDVTHNPPLIGVPSGQYRDPQMLLMEIDNMSSPEGLQLGGGLILSPTIMFHVISNRRYDKDDLIDFLTLRQHESMTFVDLGDLPPQFDYYGDVTSDFDTYGALTQTYGDRLVRIEEVALEGNDDLKTDGFFTAMVAMTLTMDVTEET